MRIVFPVTLLASAQVTAHVTTSGTILISGVTFLGIPVTAFRDTAIGKFIEADRMGTGVAVKLGKQIGCLWGAAICSVLSPTMISLCYFVCMKEVCSPSFRINALHRPSCFPEITISATISKSASAVPFHLEH